MSTDNFHSSSKRLTQSTHIAHESKVMRLALSSVNRRLLQHILPSVWSQSSLIPRPFLAPVLDHLQHAKNGAGDEGLGIRLDIEHID